MNMDQEKSNRQYLCKFDDSNPKPCCQNCACANLTEDQWKTLIATMATKDENIKSGIESSKRLLNSETKSQANITGVPKTNHLLLDNWNIDTEGWKTIEIYLFSNGQHDSPPRKYIFKSQDLHWWDATKDYIGRCHYGPNHSRVVLYTLDGLKITSPLELSNGAAYVVVQDLDTFQPAGYAHYLSKAQRSRAKRQEQLKNAESSHSDPGCHNQSSEELGTYEYLEETNTDPVIMNEDNEIVHHVIQQLRSQNETHQKENKREVLANHCFCYSEFSDMYSNDFIDFTIASLQSKNEAQKCIDYYKKYLDGMNIEHKTVTEQEQYLFDILNIKNDYTDNVTLEDIISHETETDRILDDPTKLEYVPQAIQTKSRRPVSSFKRKFTKHEFKNTGNPCTFNSSPPITLLGKDEFAFVVSGNGKPNRSFPKQQTLSNSNDRAISSTQKYVKDASRIITHHQCDNHNSDLCHKSLQGIEKHGIEIKGNKPHDVMVVPEGVINKHQKVTTSGNKSLRLSPLNTKTSESMRNNVTNGKKITAADIPKIAPSNRLGAKIAYLNKNRNVPSPYNRPPENKSLLKSTRKIATDKNLSQSSRNSSTNVKDNKANNLHISSKSFPDTKKKQSPQTPRKVLIPRPFSGVNKKSLSPIASRKITPSRPGTGQDRKVALTNKIVDAKLIKNATPKKEVIKIDSERLIKDKLVAEFNKDKDNKSLINLKHDVKPLHEKYNDFEQNLDTVNSDFIKTGVENNNNFQKTPEVKYNTIIGTINSKIDLEDEYSSNITKFDEYQELLPEKKLAASEISDNATKVDQACTPTENEVSVRSYQDTKILEFKDEATSQTRSEKGSQAEIEIPIVDKDQQVINPIVLRRKSVNTTNSIASGDTMTNTDGTLKFIVIKSNEDRNQNKIVKDTSIQDQQKYQRSEESDDKHEITELKVDDDKVNVKNKKIENVIIKDRKCTNECECLAQCEHLYNLDDNTYEYFRLLKGTFVKIDNIKACDPEMYDKLISRNYETDDGNVTNDKITPFENIGDISTKCLKNKLNLDEIETDDRNPFSFYRIYDIRNAPEPANNPAATPFTAPATSPSTTPDPATRPHMLHEGSTQPLDADTTYADSFNPDQHQNTRPAHVEKTPAVVTEVVGTQTSWTNLMLVPKLHSDGRISLHIPPLSSVKYNMYHG